MREIGLLKRKTTLYPTPDILDALLDYIAFVACD